MFFTVRQQRRILLPSLQMRVVTAVVWFGICLSVMGWAAAPQLIRLSDDGGWCWFEDERAIVTGGKLIVGTIASGRTDPRRKGDVEVISYDLTTGATSRHTLLHTDDPAQKKHWMDDHNSPAFLVRTDGRILAMFSQHGPEAAIYYRISAKPNDPSSWDELKTVVPSPTSRVTYSNLHLLRKENFGKGRIYDLFRGLHASFKPSYMTSDDFGESWTPGNVFVDVPLQFKHRPYVKYASDGEDTIHIAYTDGHPRDFDNSIYHVFYRGGQLHRSDGTPIRSLREGLKTPEEGTRVFAGDAKNVAWISDLHIDRAGRPYLAFSVQKDSAGLPSGQGGTDHRYHYAYWNGTKWVDSEVAYAGHRIYAGEDDYTGLPCLDPHDPEVMYISTNADPSTGQPLISAADGKRHWEIFRGTRGAAGRWTWTAITRDSTEDNLRPLVPIWPGSRYALLWLRGTMRSYTDYRFEVVGMIAKR
jgi:hypothetical protein